jgi:acetyl esterase/lipase
MDIIKLWDKVPESADGFEPFLEPFLLEDGQPHGAVIVCPGGAYTHRAPHEGAPVAERMNREGFHAFVLQYRVSPNPWPAPQQDAGRAIRIVRSNAKEWNIIPDKIAMLGFSAGGHLAASLSVYFDSEYTNGGDEMDAISCRPDAVIPCYPVISTDPEFAHPGSPKSLFGENPTQAQLDIFSLEKQVTPNTPPVFMWHTAEDPSVPVKNSLSFAAALSDNKVPFELHVFPEGRHGLGMKPDVPHILIWPELAARWLRNMGW